MDGNPPKHSGYERAKFAVTSRRLLIMIMALFAPELMITWAARQFFLAFVQLQKRINDTFGARVVHPRAHGDLNFGEECIATLLTEIPPSHEGNNSNPSALQATVFKFTGMPSVSDN
jgi:hypothetical protein